MTVRGFKIDAATGDLSFTAGRLDMVEDTEAIAQAIRSRIRLIKGEWAFNTAEGVDYFDTFAVKNPDLVAVRAQLVAAIDGTPGVATLESLELDFDRTARTLTAAFEATADTGELVSSTVEV